MPNQKVICFCVFVFLEEGWGLKFENMSNQRFKGMKLSLEGEKHNNNNNN